MIKNVRKRNQVESDVPHQNSSEAINRREKDDQLKVVNNKECLTITSDRSFVLFCTGNAVFDKEKKVLETNGQG